MPTPSFGPAVTGSQASGATLTLQFTAPPATTGGALCVAVFANATAADPSSATFANKSMRSAAAANSGDNTVFCELFVLEDPPEGTADIVITMPASVTNWAAIAFMLFGADTGLATDLAVTAGATTGTTITADHPNAES